MTDRENTDEQDEGAPPLPTGADVAGPGTVRQGSGYSGTASGGVEDVSGHDSSPEAPPTAGYMGGTTSSDDPPEQVIDLRTDE